MRCACATAVPQAAQGPAQTQSSAGGWAELERCARHTEICAEDSGRRCNLCMSTISDSFGNAAHSCAMGRAGGDGAETPKSVLKKSSAVEAKAAQAAQRVAQVRDCDCGGSAEGSCEGCTVTRDRRVGTPTTFAAESLLNHLLSCHVPRPRKRPIGQLFWRRPRRRRRPL